MNSMARIIALASIVFFVGCATMESGSGGGTTAAPAAKASSSGTGTVKQLSDEDYKKIGVQETYEKR